MVQSSGPRPCGLAALLQLERGVSDKDQVSVLHRVSDLVLEHVSVSLVPVVRAALPGDVDPFPSDVDVPVTLLQLSHPHGQEISLSAYVFPSSCEKGGLGKVEGEDGFLAVLEMVG